LARVHARRNWHGRGCARAVRCDVCRPSHYVFYTRRTRQCCGLVRETYKTVPVPHTAH
jgi:hypothetical protein